jgi:hypothetical protein
LFSYFKFIFYFFDEEEIAMAADISFIFDYVLFNVLQFKVFLLERNYRQLYLHKYSHLKVKCFLKYVTDMYKI